MTLIDYLNGLEKGTLIKVMNKTGYTQWETDIKVNKLLAGRLSGYTVEKVKENNGAKEIYLKYFSDRYSYAY